MKNRKFVFLMREFIQSMKIPCAHVDNNQALVGTYGNIECRIEDGSSAGAPGKLFILIKLDDFQLDADIILELNSNFKLLDGCYISRIEDFGYFLVKICVVPNHVNQLHNYINETVSSARNLIKEISSYVAD